MFEQIEEMELERNPCEKWVVNFNNKSCHIYAMRILMDKKLAGTFDLSVLLENHNCLSRPSGKLSRNGPQFVSEMSSSKNWEVGVNDTSRHNYPIKLVILTRHKLFVVSELLQTGDEWGCDGKIQLLRFGIRRLQRRSWWWWGHFLGSMSH